MSETCSVEIFENDTKIVLIFLWPLKVWYTKDSRRRKIKGINFQ